MDQAVIVTDVDGTIRRWNGAAERLYGWTSGEVIGRNIVDITPPPHARPHAEAIMRQLRAGSAWSGTFPVRRQDGTTFVAVVTDSPVFDAEGHLVEIVGLSTNYTSRFDTLTPREYTIVQLLATGATNTQIALAVGAAPGTIRNAIARAITKLGVVDRTQAALLAYRAGLGAAAARELQPTDASDLDESASSGQF